MLSDEKIDELIELIDDEIPVRDVAVTIDTYRPAIREAVRKWYAAQQKMPPTLLESVPILDDDGELVGTESVEFETPQSR